MRSARPHGPVQTRTSAGLLIGAGHVALVAALWQVAPQAAGGGRAAAPPLAGAVLQVSLQALAPATPPASTPPHVAANLAAQPLVDQPPATPMAAAVAVLAAVVAPSAEPPAESPQTPAQNPPQQAPALALAMQTSAPSGTAAALSSRHPDPPETRIAQADHRHCTAQAYPAALRERGIEGAVTLRVKVDAQGQPADVQVLAGSGWRLFDDAALQRVRGCRFMPALRDGLAIDSWVEFPVRFTLAG